MTTAAMLLEAQALRDLIFAAVRSRGVILHELNFLLKRGIPTVRFGVDGANMAGAEIRIPGGPESVQKVITVSGPSGGWSRSWQRRRDDTFDIPAVGDFLVVLVAHERAKFPPPKIEVPIGQSPSRTGLLVVQLAGIRLGVVPPATTPEGLFGRLAHDRHRQRIGARLEGDGLSEADLRVMADVASMQLWRPNKVDHDPFEPFSNEVLPVAVLGNATPSGVERRYVLVLDYETPEVLVADPAGQGLTTMNRAAFLASWKLGERRGVSWVGLIGSR